MTDRQAIKGMLPKVDEYVHWHNGEWCFTPKKWMAYRDALSADALLKRVVSGKLLERKLETSICKSCEGWGKCIDRKRCKYLISMRRRIVHALRKEFLILRRFR